MIDVNRFPLKLAPRCLIAIVELSASGCPPASFLGKASPSPLNAWLPKPFFILFSFCGGYVMSLPGLVSKVSPPHREPFFTATIYSRSGCDLFLPLIIVFALDYAPTFLHSLSFHILTEGSFACSLRLRWLMPGAPLAHMMMALSRKAKVLLRKRCD
jgi:hypothetical protein